MAVDPELPSSRANHMLKTCLEEGMICLLSPTWVGVLEFGMSMCEYGGGDNFPLFTDVLALDKHQHSSPV